MIAPRVVQVCIGGYCLAGCLVGEEEELAAVISSRLAPYVRVMRGTGAVEPWLAWREAEIEHRVLAYLLGCRVAAAMGLRLDPGATPAEVAHQGELAGEVVRSALGRLVRAREVMTEGGHYLAHWSGAAALPEVAVLAMPEGKVSHA